MQGRPMIFSSEGGGFVSPSQIIPSPLRFWSILCQNHEQGGGGWKMF